MATDLEITVMNDAAMKSAAWHRLDAIAPQRSAQEDFSTSDLLKLARQLDSARSVISRQEARIAELEALSAMDELTGLYNRRGFFHAFTQELDRARRGISPGGLLVMIDLDNFKAVNDTFGHAAGDACLRLVGETLNAEIRPMDTAARLGGDEFVLLLCGADRDRAAARVQALTWDLNRLAVSWNGSGIAINASVGLKHYTAGDTANAIFQQADFNMYNSKKAGRPGSAGFAEA